jgi:O-antigen/teichoic acid export membrane protein
VPSGRVTDVAPAPDGDATARGARGSHAAGRIARGMAANSGGVGITVLIQLVTVPVLLAAWGVSVYGEWLVLAAIPTYVALSDLSFSSVAGNKMVMLVAQGKSKDAAELGRHLWSVVTVLTGFAVLAAVVIAVLFGGALGSAASISAPEARVVLVALFLRVALGNQYGVFDAWFRAGGHYPLGVTLGQVMRLLEFGALMGAVLLGAGPGTAAVAMLLGSLVGFVIAWYALRRTVPFSTFRPEPPHLETFRQLLAPGLAFMVFPVGIALSVQGFTIVIAATLGAAAVVTFSTTRTITRVPLQVVGVIHNSIWPELSRSVGGGRIDEARAILRRSVQLALACSLPLVIGLAIFGAAIIRWWTRGLVDPPPTLLSILLVVIVVNSLWYMLSSVLAATNQHKRLAVVYLVFASTSLLAAVPLSTVFGLEGAAMALLVMDVPLIAYVFPAALRVVHDSRGAFVRALFDVRGVMRLAISSGRADP